MPGKIKSTIELAMEKAAKLPRLTEEEIRQRREEEFAPRGRAIAELVLRGDLSVDQLDVELSRHGGDEGEIVQGACLTSLCQAIDVENAEAATRAFEAIGAVVRNGPLEETSRRWSGILRDYEERRQRAFSMTEEAESVSLRDLGVAGSAIRVNLQENERWRRERSALLERFRPQVEEIQRELIDHLRRGTSRA
jgi:hypothetical protein